MSRIAASGERRSSSLHQRGPANRRAVAMARSMHERSELTRLGHRRNSVDNRVRNLSSQRHRVTSVRDSVKGRSPMMARSSGNQSGVRRSVSHIRRTIRDGQRRAVISRQRLGQRRTIAVEMRRSALDRRSALNRRNADTTRRATTMTRQASRSQVDRRSVQRVRSNVERRMLDVSRTRLGNTRIRTTTRRSAVERRARYDHRRLPLRSDLNRGMVASNREIRERRSVQINRRSLRDRRVAPTSNARRVAVGSATGGLIREAVRTYSVRHDLTRRNTEPVRRVAERRARALTRRVTSNTRRVAVNSEPAVARRTTVGYRRNASMGRRLAPVSQRHAVRAVVQLHKAGESSGITIVLSVEEPDLTTSNATATTIKDSNADSEFVPQEKVMFADEDVDVAVSEKNTYQFVEGSTLQSTGVFVTSNFTELNFPEPVFVKANHTAWENEPLRIDRLLATAMPASVI
ncbi:serine/arginine repetitive matrix protein 2-like [Ptychodera flava]|uniref:serine/arginine repetitive matrix protein 2-like n=1 Tax=Ptychodera flava TaxID=63121 RepID=UPI003969F2D6